MKNKRKMKIYFSMDPDIHQKFEDHVELNMLDKSKVIEKLIENFLKSK